MWHNSTEQSPHTMFHGPARSCSFNSIQTLKLVISQVYCVWFSNTLDVVDLIWFDLIRNPEHLMGLYKSGSIFLLWSCCKDMHEISTIAVTTLQFNNNLILMAWSHRKVYNLPSAVNRVFVCVCVFPKTLPEVHYHSIHSSSSLCSTLLLALWLLNTTGNSNAT